MLIKVFKDFSLGSALLFLLGSFVLYGCGAGSPTGPSGTAQVALAVREPESWAAANETLTQVKVTVSASNIQTITKVLTSPPWRTSITVAAGNNRLIEVTAMSNLDNQYYGEATVNLSPGETKKVTIKLTLNRAPVITDITFSPNTIAVASGAVTMTCIASDADNDSLTYDWSASDGTLSSATTNPTTLSNPSASGAITVTCVVSDGRGGSDSLTESITATASGAISMPFGF